MIVWGGVLDIEYWYLVFIQYFDFVGLVDYYCFVVGYCGMIFFVGIEIYCVFVGVDCFCVGGDVQFEGCCFFVFVFGEVVFVEGDGQFFVEQFEKGCIKGLGFDELFVLDMLGYDVCGVFVVGVVQLELVSCVVGGDEDCIDEVLFVVFCGNFVQILN